MVENERLNIRLSQELLTYCKKNVQNISLFIREAMREKINSGLLTDPALEFVEIRATTPYIYFAKLDSVIDGDTLLVNFDLGFFTSVKERVRLIGINAPEINSKKGKEAAAFIEKELKHANLLVETKKKEKYGRYLAFVYYSTKYNDFEDILRHGKLLNEQLVSNGHANKYEES